MKRLMGPMRPMRLMRLIGLMLLLGCGGSDDTGALVPPEPPTPTPTPTPTPAETAITFSGVQSEGQTVTRAAGRRATPLSAKAESFRVWGYKNMAIAEGVFSVKQDVMPGFTVNWVANSAATTTTNSSDWEYVGQGTDQTIKYWDWGAAAYRFFAVTKWEGEINGPYEANKAYGANEAYEAGTYGAGAYKAYKISMVVDATHPDAAPFFSRLWFSTGNPVDYPDKQFGKPVTLEFMKPFSRVRFMFKYVYPREGITLETPSFKPYDGTKIARKGTVDIHYPLDGTETQERYTAEPDVSDSALDYFTEDYDPETESDGGWYLVLPNPKNTKAYTLSVTVGGSPKSVNVPAEYMQWLPGYSYTYVFKITDEGGVEIGWVEYAVTPWTDMEADRTVYNW